MNKRFAIILAGLVVVFGGLLIFNKKEANAPKNGEKPSQKAELTNHKTGQGTSGVTLTEYGDFQCPACFQFYPVVKQVKEMYGDQITFQFRHFPLTQSHNYALLAARAAEAAGTQDKFFEMHDLLYENQQIWSNDSNPTKIFEGYAKQLGLDIDQFREDMKSEAANDSVQADLAEANRLGYNSTPTFEINGEKIENPRDLNGFKKVIDDAIAKQKSSNEGDN